MSKKWVITTVIVVAIFVAGGLTMLKPWERDSNFRISPPPLPQLPQQGQQITVLVAAGYEDGTSVEGVRITFLDKDTGNSWSQHTGPYGRAEFTLISGNTYLITTQFHNSVKSATYVARPYEAVGIFISGADTINSIIHKELPTP